MPGAYDEELKRQSQRLPEIQRKTIAEILRLLKDAEARVIAQLASASPSASAKLQAQKKAIAEAIARFSRDGDALLQGSLGSAWQAGIDLVEKPIAAGGITLGPALAINDRALVAMRSFTTDRIKDVGLQAVNRINGVLGQVLIGTKPMSDAITDVQRIMGGITRKRAMTIAFHQVGTAYSTASYDSMLAAQRAGVKMGKRWIKSGKAHPRPSHVAAHNQIVRVDQPFQIVDPKTGELEELRYPRDPRASPGNTINCGCMSVPVVDGSTFGASVVVIPDDPKQKVRKVKREERAADNRQVVARVHDRLDRFLKSDLGAGDAGLTVTRGSDDE